MQTSHNAAIICNDWRTSLHGRLVEVTDTSSRHVTRCNPWQLDISPTQCCWFMWPSTWTKILHWSNYASQCFMPRLCWVLIKQHLHKQDHVFKEFKRAMNAITFGLSNWVQVTKTIQAGIKFLDVPFDMGTLFLININIKWCYQSLLIRSMGLLKIWVVSVVDQIKSFDIKSSELYWYLCWFGQ